MLLGLDRYSVISVNTDIDTNILWVMILVLVYVRILLIQRKIGIVQTFLIRACQ